MALPSVVSNILGAIAQKAGSSVAQDPQIQAALASAQSELAFYKGIAIVGGVIIGAEFLFFYLPRFESPIPRGLRRRR